MGDDSAEKRWQFEEADSLQSRAFCSNRMWINDKQLTAKSRISRQVSKQYTLCLYGSYSTKHGDKHLLQRL